MTEEDIVEWVRESRDGDRRYIVTKRLADVDHLREVHGLTYAEIYTAQEWRTVSRGKDSRTTTVAVYRPELFMQEIGGHGFKVVW